MYFESQKESEREKKKKGNVKTMTSRDGTLISGLKQLSVVIACVATADLTLAEVSRSQRQNTTNYKSFHMGAAHKITGAR